jgi:hypothetical protein
MMRLFDDGVGASSPLATAETAAPYSLVRVPDTPYLPATVPPYAGE